VQNGLEAATNQLQAIQRAHQAEIAFIAASKETDILAVKTAAVKRVKQLIAELDGIKLADSRSGCAAEGTAVLP
jgi:hypothetical protein